VGGLCATDQGEERPYFKSSWLNNAYILFL
jgi:hypothetical protein